jgi:hypothetical protein
MKKLKVAITARELLHLVTPETIEAHFRAQQDRLLRRGRITKRISRRRLHSYAVACYQSYAKQVREAESPRELALVQHTAMKHLSVTKTDFLGAVWKGDRHSTIEHLN